MCSKGSGSKAKAVWLAASLLCALSPVWAVVRPPPSSPYDDDVASAPEPQVLIMLAGGLGLAGVYVIYRMRRKQQV